MSPAGDIEGASSASAIPPLGGMHNRALLDLCPYCATGGVKQNKGEAEMNGLESVYGRDYESKGLAAAGAAGAVETGANAAIS